MDGFTNSEKAIAQFILDNPSKFQNLTSEELANKTYTSRATVIRLCKKLSTSGYREFQRMIISDLNEMYKIKSMISEEPVDETSTYKDIINIVPSIYELAITNTKMILNHLAMNRVLNKLKYSRKISIYGIGISYTIAETAAFKFMSLGIQCSAFNGLNEHYVQTSKSKKEEVAIVISLTGSNPNILRIAEYMKKNGIFVIGIIGSEYNEIANFCDEILEVYSKKQILSLEVINGLTAANYIFDILFVSLLVQDYQHNVDAAIEVLKYKDY